MQARTRTAWAGLLIWVLALASGSMARASEVSRASIAYVAQAQGKATAQSGAAAPRPLERFSPLFAGDMLTIPTGGKLMARFVSTGQTQTYTAADPPAQRRVALPAGPSNDVKSRLMRAVFDDQRAGLAEVSRNHQAAVRDLAPPPLVALLPRQATLRHNLTFTWRVEPSVPVQIAVYDSDDQLVWKARDVREDHIAYPADAPALTPKAVYHWTVSRSETEISAPVEFKIASEAREKEIARRLEMLKAVDFADAEEADLTIAAMFIKSNLYSNALQILAPLTDKSVSPLVHVLRFQAYEQIELKEYAWDEKLAQGKSGDALKAQWQQAESLPE